MGNEQEAPQIIDEDVIAQIMEAATAASLEAMNEMLAPLIQKVETLQKGEEISPTSLPRRKGMIVTEPVERDPPPRGGVEGLLLQHLGRANE